MGMSALQKKLLNTEESFWVDASAGSGKTFVLVERILALIASGVAPYRILMLTFTNAAAHEVIARVNRRIQDCAKTSSFWEDVFKITLEKGGVSAQTLHSFCHGLWQKFCVERGWGYACRLGSDEEQRELLERAINQAFGVLDPWMKRCIVGQMSFAMAQRMVKKLLSYRAIYNLEVFGPSQSAVRVLQDIWRGIPRKGLEVLTRERSTKTRTAAHMIDVVRRVWIQPEFSRSLCLEYVALFVTAQGTARVRFCPKEFSEYQRALEQEAQRVVDLVHQMRLWEDTKISLAMHTFMVRTQEQYVQQKKQQGIGDYDDIIHEARALLKKNHLLCAHIAQNIEHVLVDEAQDTSVVQWEILCALLSLVCAAWPHARVFVVGDYKQSIYGFQGVRTNVTKTVQNFLQDKLSQMTVVSMDTSYRCAPAIINVVNTVGAKLDWPKHHAARKVQGHVVVQDVGALPQERAAAIAEIVHGIVTGGVFLPSRQRCAQPQDVLLLSKQRDEVFGRMPEALALKGLPCFGVDRARAMDYPLIIATVMMMDVLVLPADDVALMQVLQSPWFGWSFEAVHTMLVRKTTTLWEALRASTVMHAKEVVDFIVCAQAWIKEGLLPFFYWFFQTKRQVTATAFGDVGKDAFMLLCEEFDMTEGLGLAAFMRYVRVSNPVVKNVAPESAKGVRLLSVHGSKGLEAPIVVLMDADRPLREEKVPWTLDEHQRLHVSSQGALWKRKTFLHESAQEEHNRLLYVALTRAQDILCVLGGGWNTQDSWYAKVQEAVDPGGSLETLYSAKPEVWCASKRQEPETQTQHMPPCERFTAEAVQGRSYGKAMHLVLSSLVKDGPDVSWARRIIHRVFEDKDQERALKDVLLCLQSADFARLCSYQTIDVESTLQVVDQDAVLVGRPDYIGRQGNEVLIVDFKTSVFAKGIPADVARQLSLYAQLARTVYHGAQVKTAVFLISQAKLSFLP